MADDDESTSSAPSGLQRKIGPFPVVAWLGIIGGGIVLGLILRRTGAFKRDNAPADLPEGDESAGAPPGSGAGVTSGAAVGRVPQSAGTGSVTPAGTPVVTQTYATNADWQRAAIAALIAVGIDAITAARAVGKYLDGATLDYAEGQALAIVLKQLGAPPEYVPTPNVEAPPSSAPIGRADPNPIGDQFIQPSPSGVGVRYVVQPSDGDLAQFVTDYTTVEWIPPDGPLRKPTNVANQHDAGGFPIPYPIDRATLDRLAKRGPAPQYPGDYTGPRTAW